MLVDSVEHTFFMVDRFSVLVGGNFKRSSGIWQGIESCDRFSPDFVLTVIIFLCKASSDPMSSKAWSPACVCK